MYYSYHPGEQLSVGLGKYFLSVRASNDLGGELTVSGGAQVKEITRELHPGAHGDS